MEFDFTDKHVVVTGGTGSLGLAVTEKLLEAGARCSIPGYSDSIPESFDRFDGERLFVKTGVDLTNERESAEFYEEAVDTLGPLWAAVNVAGGFGMGAIGDTPASDFMKQIRLNLLTCYNSTRAAVERMRRTGSGGRIVNIASRPALEPRQGAGMTAYTAAKAGVAAFTGALAAELADEEILVNAVAPSIIDTPANRKAMPDADYGTWPKPDEIATQILYLASPHNRVSRGGVIPVYGKS